MTEDPTRAMPRDPRPPSHGSVGPADPTADPATHPSLMPVPPPGLPGESPTVPTPSLPAEPEPGRPASRSARGPVRCGSGPSSRRIVLIFLLIFILQNNVPVQINFLGVSGTLPTGVALLFAAIAGLLLGAIPGSVRILQLRRAARRGRRTALTCCASPAVRCPWSAGRGCTSAASRPTTRPISGTPPPSSGPTSRPGCCGTWASRSTSAAT